MTQQYRDRQKAYVNAFGLKEGEKVIVTHRPDTYSNTGWGSGWNPEMTNMIGRTCKYKQFGNSNGLLIEDTSTKQEYYFPYFCIVPVAPIKPASGVTVVREGVEIELPPGVIKQIDELLEDVLCQK